MEIFCQYPESHPFESDFQSLNLPKTPPISDASSCGSTISGEEFLLASCHPKRRSGRKKFRETRHPVYRGVRQRNSNKWVCELREPNKTSRIWLGTFQTAEMAARAHDVAALALRGRSACLNFADSAWRLPVPVSANAKDIQKAAAEAAESFRPSISEEISCDTVTSSNSEEMCCDTVTSSNSNGMFCNTERTENATMSPETFFYMDEETVFEMPSLLANMAEGLLLSPPPRYYWDDLESYADVSLWSYSN